jgi:hypothetical protein
MTQDLESLVRILGDLAASKKLVETSESAPALLERRKGERHPIRMHMISEWAAQHRQGGLNSRRGFHA